MREVRVWLIMAAIATLLSSCDQLVLGQGELDAKRRFDSVAIGQTEAQVIARLGPPTAVFLRQTDGSFASQSSTEAARTLARHLKGFREPKVVAYLDGSVLAYYAISNDGLVAGRAFEVS